MRRMSLIRFALPTVALLAFLFGADAVHAGGPPAYEQAFVLGQTVTNNAIEVPHVANEKAPAEFYQDVHTIEWPERRPKQEQQRCDHVHQATQYTHVHQRSDESEPSPH